MSTRNPLPEISRAPMIALCNARVADAIDLKLRSKQAHWNVKGPTFRSLHKLFDAIADAADDYADQIAERAVQLGGVAEGTLAVVSEASDLPAFPSVQVDAATYIENMAASVADFCAVCGRTSPRPWRPRTR